MKTKQYKNGTLFLTYIVWTHTDEQFSNFAAAKKRANEYKDKSVELAAYFKNPTYSEYPNEVCDTITVTKPATKEQKDQVFNEAIKVLAK